MTKLAVLQKTANYKDRLQKLMDRRGGDAPDARLEKFRKLILEHLSTLDDEEPEAAPGAARKAFSSMMRMEKGGKGLAVGTMREWKGRKFKKIAPGKWRTVYDGETRGAKMAIAAVKRKIAAAPDAHAMMRIILENRDRFSDKDGQPLPFVQELSKYIASEQDRRDQALKRQRKEKQDSRKKADQQAKNIPQESKAVQPKDEKFGEKSSDFNYKGRDAALKAVKILEERGDTSRNFKEALAFIGSPEFEKLHEMIDDYMDNVFQNGVNMENPEEKDLVQYVKNYYGAAFGAGGVPKEIAGEYDFINDYVVWPTKLREILESHIHWEDGKSAYESADGFAKLVMDIGDAKNLEDIEELSKEAISAMDKEKTKIQKSISNVIDFFRNLRAGKGPRFVKKSVPVCGADGEAELSEGWMRDSIEGIAPYVEEAGISETGKKVVAVDFDGVINSYISGWKGPAETDAPVLSTAESLKTLYNRGYKVIIFSTRANTQEGIDTIREYLRKHTENNELADTIEITDKKPIADMYIDDRAIPFTGDWEETLKRIEEFKPWAEKSLTWSGYPLQGRTKVHGMDISIENKKGSVCSGTDKDGHEWSIKMNFDYGYIRGTVGKDKDHVDAYVGPNPEAETVFIVHQNDPATGEYDEDKVMLGFNTEEEARKAYLSQYDRPGFLGDIDAMDIETFKEKAFDPANKGKRLA